MNTNQNCTHANAGRFIERMQDNIDKLDLSISNAKELLDVLKMNRDIKGEQNGLSVTELTKLMDYYPGKIN